MYVTRYISNDRCWQVGFYSPDGLWHEIFDFESAYEASLEVNFLNGGSGIRQTIFGKSVKDYLLDAENASYVV